MNIKQKITTGLGTATLALAPALATAPVGQVKMYWVGTAAWVACVAIIGIRNGALWRCTF